MLVGRGLECRGLFTLFPDVVVWGVYQPLFHASFRHRTFNIQQPTYSGTTIVLQTHR